MYLTKWHYYRMVIGVLSIILLAPLLCLELHVRTVVLLVLAWLLLLPLLFIQEKVIQLL